MFDKLTVVGKKENRIEVNRKLSNEDKTQIYSTWGDKLLGHTDVLYSIQKQKTFKPITIQLAPTELCSSDCPFCSVANRPIKNYMDFELIVQSLVDFKHLGAKSVELSTDSNEQITIRKAGEKEIKRMPIGMFVDSFLGKKVKDNHFENKDTGFEVLSCDDYGNVSFEKITGLLRYKRKKQAYRITLDGGMSIILSENHSICKYDSSIDKIVKVKPEQLKLGEDFIPWISQNFSQKEEYVKINTNKIKNSLRQSMGVPDFPNEIIIDKEFSKFLGIFIAEGCVSKDKIHTSITLNFSKKDDRLCKTVTNIAKKLNSNTLSSDKGSAYTIKIMSKVLGLALHNLNYLVEGDGTPATRKKIPDVIFNSPRECQVEFLKGLIAGDGYKKVRQTGNSTIEKTFNLSTASRTLCDDVFVLCNSLGYKARIEYSKNKLRKIEGRTLKPSTKYNIVITTKISKQTTWQERIPVRISSDYKKRNFASIFEIDKYKHLSTINNSIKNNIRFSRVKKVELTNEASEWFYDIEVENTKTFFSSNNILAFDTGGGDPLLYKDPKRHGKNINDIIELASELGYDIGIITNSHNLKKLDRALYKVINWIRISLIQLDEGKNPEDYYFNEFPKDKLGFSYIVYEGTESSPIRKKKYEGTTLETIKKIQSLVELHPEVKFVRIAGDCLIKGNNQTIKEQYFEVIKEIDRLDKFFIKDIGTNDSPFEHGCYVGAIRPYIASAPHSTEPTDYHVYTCTSHVLQKRTYDLDYSLCHVKDIKKTWEQMNYNYRGKGYPYEVKGNKGKCWTDTCSHCYYANNNQLLHTISQPMIDRNFA